MTWSGSDAKFFSVDPSGYSLVREIRGYSLWWSGRASYGILARDMTLREGKALAERHLKGEMGSPAGSGTPLDRP